MIAIVTLVEKTKSKTSTTFKNKKIIRSVSNRKSRLNSDA